MTDNTTNNVPSVPTKLGSVDEVAAFLAWKYLCRSGIPTEAQLELYCGEDGQYFCAVNGCENTGVPQRGADTMVTMGPIVLCHQHGCEALGKLKGELGQEPDTRWFYLNKTVHMAGVMEDEEPSQVEKRHDRSREEMAGRVQRLAEALDWAPRHREYVARVKDEKKAAECGPATQESGAESPAQESKREPEVNPYVGKSAAELKKLATAVDKGLTELEKFKDVLPPADYSVRKAAYEKASSQIAEAAILIRQEAERKDKAKRAAAAYEALAKLDTQLGITASGIRVEICAPRRPVHKVATGEPQKTAGAKPESPALKPKGTPAQFPCNCASELKGNPAEQMEKIPSGVPRVFRKEDYPDSADCDKALDATGEPWRRMLLDHAPEGAKRDDVLSSSTEVNKAAKDMAKSCLLHGPLSRTLSGIRGPVIKHYIKNWKDKWAERMSRVGDGNGHSTRKGEYTCSECGNKVNRLFPKPVSAYVEESEVKGKKVAKIVVKDEVCMDRRMEPGELVASSFPKESVCGKCRQAHKNRVTKAAREEMAVRKSTAEQERQKGARGSTGEQGGGKKGKGKSGGKKGK